jgi:probable HAF family extracellular repeat protein
MKSRILTCITLMILFATLVIPGRLAALENQDGNHKHHHYKLIDVGTFGGPSSYFSAFFDGAFFSSANVLNNSGTFVGWGDVPAEDSFPAFCFNVNFGDCHVSHALRWQTGVSTDLGSLADDWSSAATWINSAGEIVGVSQNGVIDPAIGFPEERAVLWRDGHMIDFGTLGGNQSSAASINNHGQIAGLALNTTPDPFYIYDLLFYGSSSGTQTRAVLWDENDNAKDLGTLGGPDASAAFVNDHGQVTGISYTNSTPNAFTGLPTFHPFLWEKGKGMQDLGTLGGTIAQAVNGMNEGGEVVGSTTMAGDQIHHPFLWDGKKLIDLGTFGGDNGEADWINKAGDVVGIAQKPIFCPDGNGGDAFLWSHGVLHDLGTSGGFENSEVDFTNTNGQVVGYSFSCDPSIIPDAFLWEKGSIVDLNSLIPSNSGFYLWAAEFISDRGEIASVSIAPNGDTHAVLLIPCDENHRGIEGCDYSMVDATAKPPASAVTPTVPRSTLPALLWRRNNWFHFPAIGPKD